MYHFTPVGKVQVPKTTYGTVQQPRHISRKMNELFTGFKNVRAYIDDLLVLTKCLFSDHLAVVKSVFKKLKEAGLKVNANKSFLLMKN